jgi:4-amino-4-deoxy-L-arabinose transferase-like glycosyltransferase
MDDLVPNQSRPVGYGFLIMRPAAWVTHDLTLVSAIQHLLGLATGVLIYALLRRRGVRVWVATLAAVPVLFDAMLLVLEHTALSDVLFVFLVVASIAALGWRADLNPKLVLLGGLLLGTSVTVRLVAEPLIVVAVIFCLWAGHRWRTRLVAAGLVVAGFAVPVLAYATWYQQEHGVFALSEFTGKTLYLRSTSFVECDRIDVPDYQRVLCPTDPVGERRDPTWYVFSVNGNLQDLELPEGVTEDEALRQFARAAITAQPMDYLETVGRDFVLNFMTYRDDYGDYETAWKWTFATYDAEDVRDLDAPFYPGHGGMLQAHQPWSGFLVDYEKYAYLAGPLLLGCLVVGCVGVVAPSRNGRRDLRPLTFLVVVSGVAILAAPDLTAEFVWRYQLPAIALLPMGAALAFTSMRREPAAQPPTVATASTD